MGCKHDARWAWAQIAHKGVTVRHIEDGSLFTLHSAKPQGVMLVCWGPNDKAWRTTVCISFGRFELVKPDAVEPDMPAGYERWPRSTQSLDVAFVLPGTASGQKLSDVLNSRRFGCFEFRREDLIVYDRTLNVCWHKEKRHFVFGHRTQFEITEVEPAIPIAVLMLKEPVHEGDAR